LHFAKSQVGFIGVVIYTFCNKIHKTILNLFFEECAFRYQKPYHRGWGLQVKGGKNLKFKSRKYNFLIVAIILLTGLTIVAYFHPLETKVKAESQQVLIQKDSDTNVEAIASVSKSTVILIFCIVLVGLLGGRRKKDSQANFYLKGKKSSKIS
jgi:hypothetical protein